MKSARLFVLGMLLPLMARPAEAAPLQWGGSGDEIDHAPSARVCAWEGGAAVSCGHAAPAPGGWYTARHVTEPGFPVLEDGIVRPFSRDAERDLAHIEDAASPASPLGAAITHDILTWRNTRGWGAVRVAGETMGGPGGLWAGDPLIVTCRVAGLHFVRGDSGTGLHRAADGAGGAEGDLVAVFVGGELDPSPGTVEYDTSWDAWCELGQMAWLQVVP